jgi:4-amino-4-deoxy-L-arabinose transferase-like glycosyltransferase
MKTAAMSVVLSRPRGLLERLEDSAQGFELFLDRRRKLLLLLCTVSYAYVTCHRASRKLFWFDELFTVHISALSSPWPIWNALANGVDFNPPLLYILTWLSQTIFGIGQVATRLPAIVGFWVFCLCLFKFVAVRSTALAGFISLAFPLITPAYWYAYEARSHGAVLGFCGLALISWQAATSRTNHRLGPVFGLFASMACALATHSYAFLLLIPFAVGELARSDDQAYRLGHMVRAVSIVSVDSNYSAPPAFLQIQCGGRHIAASLENDVV